MAPALQHPLDVGDRVSPDVVVAGAGPAGSVAALCLARSGASVLLLERARLPRTKVCGGCVGPGALALLERLGIADGIDRAGGERFSVLELVSGSSRARLRLGSSIAVTRAALDRLLADAAEDSGVDVRDRARVCRLGVTGCGVEVTVRHRGGPEECLRTAAFVDASGLGGLPVEISGDGIVAAGVDGAPAAEGVVDGRAQEISADARVGVGAVFAQPTTSSGARPPHGVLRMVVGRGGYVGMVGVERGRLDVAAALDPSLLASHGPDGAVRRILAEAGCALPTGAPEVEWKGTPALTRRPAWTAGPRVFRVGDAAGYVEPFTGEGIGWAVSSATLAVRFVLEAVAGRPEAAARGWRRAHRRLVAPRQRVCRILSAGLRRPRLASAVVRLLSVAPRLADPLVRRTRRVPEPALETATRLGRRVRTGRASSEVAP